MNIKDIKALAAVLTQADLTALEYSEGELHIRMERAAARPAAPQPLNMSPIAAEPTLPVEEKNDFNNLCDVKAPMVGVFYAAPAPDAKPFVRVGDTVEKGQVICIIEAMKLMNEIEADATGTIREVLVENGSPVEFGQPLFVIE